MTSSALPDLKEQRRIVEVLEDHLSRLDAAIAGLNRAAARSEAWLASSVQSLIDAAGFPVRALGDLATSVKNGIYVSRPSVHPDGVPILRIGAVRRLHLSTDDLRYSARAEADLASDGALLAAGDLLFTRYNGNPAYVGACAVVESHVLPLTYPDKLIRVRMREDLVRPGFVAFASAFGDVRDQIDARVKTSAGQAGISGADLKTISVPVPELGVQESICARLDRVAEAARRVSAQAQATAERQSGLRRAILAAAFEGKLTGRHTDNDNIEELSHV